MSVMRRVVRAEIENITRWHVKRRERWESVHWWLVLECGHAEQRTRPLRQGCIPIAPRTVRCDECTRPELYAEPPTKGSR